MLIKKIGPLPEGHPAVGKICPGCNKPIEVGQTITWMAIGPGDDEEERAKARESKPYNSKCIELHWECSAIAYGRSHYQTISLL